MKKVFTITDENKILQMIQRAQYGTLALCHDNKPYSLPINYVEHNNEIYFHGSKKGKKMDILKQNLNASFSIVEDMSIIPSHFSSSNGDASPSTHLFKSIIIDGQIKFINDYDIKAQVLEALMQKLVKDGDYIPLNDKMYEKVINATCIYKLVEEEKTCKFKLGQNFSLKKAKSVIFHLKQRADAKDLETIELIEEYCKNT